MSSSLWRVASLIVTPPTETGSSTAKGRMSPNLPTFHMTFSRRVMAVVGANFQATAQRGSLPTEPRRALQLEIVDLHHHPVDLEVQLSAAPLPVQALLDHLVLAAEQLDAAVDPEAVLAQPLQGLKWLWKLSPSATPTW